MTIPTVSIYKINTIGTRSVPNLYVPNWALSQPITDHLVPPVVVNVGVPIINLPGCAKMHKDNQRHKNGIPIDKNLMEDDPSEIMTLCDAGYPTYDAMNYEPEQLIMTYEQKPPVVPPPPEANLDTPETPSIPKTDEDVPCPGPNAPRIGDVAQNQKEKVSGYELQKDPANPKKEICVILYEDIGVVEAYLPSANVATTTAAIATVAGASALLAKPLADLLLRVFKPAIKTGLTKVNKILGKTTYKPVSYTHLTLPTN